MHHRHRIVIAAVACLAFPVWAAAASGELQLPSFAHLQEKATETVDLTLPLSAAGGLMSAIPNSVEIKQVLKDLQTVQVRSYKFNADHVYSKTDIDAVRRQLSRPGWSQLVQTQDRNSNEDVGVYLAIDGDKVKGLAVIVSKPREFTIVNIIGAIDLQKLHQLEGQFGIPKLQMEDKKNKAGNSAAD